MATTIELTAADGHKLSVYRADPAGKPRGAVVVIQEIFGVNSHIRSVADGYATDGYLVIAPAMYDRVKRGYETGYSQDEIEAGRKIMQGLDWTNTMNDVDAAVGAAKSAGKVGIVGYCWGGTVAWLAAARTAGLACAVPYYGGGMPNFINEKPKVPVLCHFGELDKSPSPEQAKELLARHPEVKAHFYNGAGHGFNCDQRPSYNAEASRMARERTLAFFRQHLG
jgi:carboxymethylenebutenolidase